MDNTSKARKKINLAGAILIGFILLICGCSNIPSESEGEAALKKWIVLSDEGRCISLADFKKLGGEIKTVDDYSGKYQYYLFNYLAEVVFTRDCCFDRMTFLTTPSYHLHDKVLCEGFDKYEPIPSDVLVEVSDMDKAIKKMLIEQIYKGTTRLITYEKTQTVSFEGWITFKNAAFRGIDTSNNYDWQFFMPYKQ